MTNELRATGYWHRCRRSWPCSSQYAWYANYHAAIASPLKL